MSTAEQLHGAGLWARGRSGYARNSMASISADLPQGERLERDRHRGLESFRLHRFRRRGRALFVTHLVLLCLGAGALVRPDLLPGSLTGVFAPLLTGLGLASIASRLLLDHRLLGPVGIWLTLVFDSAALHVLIGASGGLFSPLVGTAPLLVGAFRLILPATRTTRDKLLAAAAASPALLVVPLSFGGSGWAEAVLLLWYAAVATAVWTGLGALQRAEEDSHLDVLRLEEELRRHVLAEERARLSREIHDGMGAALSSLLLQVEWGQKGGGDPLLILAELKETAESAVDDLRRSVRHLRHDFDPVESAKEQCLAFERRHGLPVSFVVEGTPLPMGPKAELTLFRVLQEALTNVLRHAQAGRVEVEMGFGPTRVDLRVRDDGRGFSPRDVGQGRYGLRGMRERAAASGGSLAIGPVPDGKGTELHLFLPVHQERR